MLTVKDPQVAAILAPKTQPDKCVLAPASVCETYQKVVDDAQEKSAAVAALQLAELQDQDCPICFCPLATGPDGNSDEELLKCGSCGKHMHSECMQNWAERRAQVGEQLSCVLCRAPWQAAEGNSSRPHGLTVGAFSRLIEICIGMFCPTWSTFQEQRQSALGRNRRVSATSGS